MTDQLPDQPDKTTVPEEGGPTPEVRASRLRLNQILLFLAAFCLIGYHLGSLSLFETSEGRYGSVARAMLDSGDWLTPRHNGLPHFTKPPFTYWLSALGMKVFGVSEAGAKAFLPFAGALTVVGCYRIGLLFLTARAALCSAFVLMTSTMFLFLFKGLTPDPLLALFETWMVWALLSFVLGRKMFHSLLFWIFAALAMITKGPPGLLPLLGIFPVLVYTGHRAALKKLLKNPLGWIIFLFVGLGWYFLVAAMHTGMVKYFLVHETVERVASDAHGRTGPWWYFIVVLLAGTFPWMPFLIEALWEELFKIRRDPRFSTLVLLGWLFVPFLLLSLSHSKLVTYALPLLVPCSLIIGNFLSKRLHIAEDEPFTYQAGAAITLVILCVLGLALIYTSLFNYIPNLRVAKLAVFLALYFMSLSIFGYMFMYLRFGKGVLMVMGIAMPGVLFFSLPCFSGHEEYYPGKFFPGVGPLLKKAGELPATSKVVCIETMLESMNFYAGRPFPTWEVTRETQFDPAGGKEFDLHGEEVLKDLASGPLYLLTRKKDLPKIQIILGKWLKPLETCGLWGLYEPGEWLPPGYASNAMFAMNQPVSSLPISTSSGTEPLASPGAAIGQPQEPTPATGSPQAEVAGSASSGKSPPASATKPATAKPPVATGSKPLPASATKNLPATSTKPLPATSTKPPPASATKPLPPKPPVATASKAIPHEGKVQVPAVKPVAPPAKPTDKPTSVHPSTQPQPPASGKPKANP